MKLAIMKKAGKAAVKFSSKALCKVKKYSPEVLIGFGIIAIGAGMVTACKATKKLDDINEDACKKLDSLKDESETENIGKEKTSIYIQTGWKYVKLYAPAVLLTTTGVACILASHGIMKKRNACLIAAYDALDKSYRDLYKRVSEKYGEETAKNLKLGLEDKGADIQTDDGTVEHENVKVTTFGKEPSIYSKFFDESSRCWKKDPELNRLFLTATQNYFNNMLQVRGHVFLNEIYDALDIQRTSAGNVVGWVLAPDNVNYIDFGLYNVYDGCTYNTNRFLNGFERSVLLDFNVDGVIIDKI